LKTKQSDIVLSPDQEQAVSSVLEWYNEAKDGLEHHTKTMGGYAGTGKTTVLSYIRRELGEDISVGFVSFTGKAVSVMRRKLYESKTFHHGLDHISTIHSFMYRPITDSKGNVIDWEQKEMLEQGRGVPFNAREWEFAPYVDLFIMDEASMTPEDLYEDLLKYNKPILAVGDHGQLPPVKGNFSLMQNPEVRLEHIHRQAEDSPILTMAHRAREGKSLLKWGDNLSSDAGYVVRMKYSDVGGSDMEREIMAEPDSTKMVIVGTNKERLNINKAVLQHIRGNGKVIKPIPQVGDRLICLKNNNKIGIYNGMLGVVIGEKECYDYPQHNWHYLFTPDESPDTIMPLTMTKYTFLNQYNKVPESVPFMEVRERFDFAYAITCHKSQGSEADKVVVMGQGFGDEEMRRRWLYTAITRARKELYLVG